MRRQSTATTSLISLAAASSIGLSITQWLRGRQQQAIFIGLWVPSILALGDFVQSHRRPT
jgi:hypothetical protein